MRTNFNNSNVGLKIFFFTVNMTSQTNCLIIEMICDLIVKLHNDHENIQKIF